MNDDEKGLILRVLDSNMQLKRLYSQHMNIEKKLEEYNHRKFLTDNEQMEAKLLKKQKLFKKDQMMELLSVYS